MPTPTPPHTDAAIFGGPRQHRNDAAGKPFLTPTTHATVHAAVFANTSNVANAAYATASRKSAPFRPNSSPKQLTEDIEAYVPTTGKPSHYDIVRIRDALTSFLLQAGYTNSHSKKNLWGIITPADAYATKYGEAFATPESIVAYPPSCRTP